jgi:uncharacterized protein (DUF2141 family)
VTSLALAWLASLAVAVGAGPATSGASAERAIRVTVTGVRVDQGGTLLVALYDGADGWLETDRARAVRRVAVEADRVEVRFEEIPDGAGCAVAVIHDRNGNGRLDMRWFPFPKPREGSGVSNNHVRAGPPDYGKARFPVNGDEVALEIVLRY